MSGVGAIKRTTVTIIGAGAAGIKAAIELKNAGVDFILLEAQNRIGGRIKTVRDEEAGTAYDLGMLLFRAKWAQLKKNHKLTRRIMVP